MVFPRDQEPAGLAQSGIRCRRAKGHFTDWLNQGTKRFLWHRECLHDGGSVDFDDALEALSCWRPRISEFIVRRGEDWCVEKISGLHPENETRS